MEIIKVKYILILYLFCITVVIGDDKKSVDLLKFDDLIPATEKPPASNQKKDSKPLTKDQIESLNALREAKGSIEKLLHETNLMTERKRNNCVIAFGDTKFCDCLSQKLPVVVSFQEYSIIITSSKKEINYEGTSKENRKVIDKVYNVREICVAEMYKRK